MLEVGMRVHMPFGKGNRLIQGIVLGLESQSDGEEMEQDLKILQRCWIFLLFSRQNNSGWLRSYANLSFLQNLYPQGHASRISEF